METVKLPERNQNPDINQQLTVDDMRKMTMLTGEIVEWQQHHLKVWPRVLFDDLDKYTVNFNFGAGLLNSRQLEGQTMGQVHYDFTFKKGFRLTKTQKDKLEHLHKFVQTLFWAEIDFKIFSKGKIIYGGK